MTIKFKNIKTNVALVIAKAIPVLYIIPDVLDFILNALDLAALMP